VKNPFKPYTTVIPTVKKNSVSIMVSSEEPGRLVRLSDKEVVEKSQTNMLPKHSVSIMVHSKELGRLIRFSDKQVAEIIRQVAEHKNNVKKFQTPQNL
jgi:hypothetical protein